MPYYQTRNHSNASPQAFVFFDTEANIEVDPDDSTVQNQTLRLGVAHYLRLVDGKPTREKTIRFMDEREFWQFMRDVSHPRIPTWVIAHNLAYDLTLVDFGKQINTRQFILSDDDLDVWGLLPPVKDKHKFVGIFCDEDPPVILQVKHQTGWRMVGMDSMNYFATSLSDMGKRLGFPKLHIDFNTATEEELFVYCERDVEILQKSMLGLVDFVKVNDLGRFRLTAPSMAMGCLRHKWPNTKYITHDNADVKKIERAGYFGGRLEMFRHGVLTGPFHALDVKSMYPFVMEHNQFPLSLWDWYCGSEFNTVKPYELAPNMMAEVLIETTTDTFPLRHENSTIYPHGTYWTTLAGPELMRAVDGDFVQAVGRWSQYQMADLFSEFVQFFGTLRDHYIATGDELFANLAKLFPNSLYGKYGQMSTGWEAIKRDERLPDDDHFRDYCFRTNTGTNYRRIGGHWQRSKPKTEHKAAFPAVAAFVTAYAREYLRELMLYADLQNVLYVVTDSLIVTDEGLQNLDRAGVIGGNRRGELTYEHASDDIELRSLHQYTMGTRAKFGSRKAKAVNLGEGRVKEDQFQGLKSIIRGGWKPVVKVTKVVKHFKMAYNRGVKNADGTISPLTVFLPERPAGEGKESESAGLDT